MPNQYRQGTVQVTLRMPETLKAEIERQAEAEDTSVSQFIRRAVDASLAARLRVVNPLRRSPRRRPRDRTALLALAAVARQRVRRQEVVRRTGPRTFELQ